MNFSNRRSAFLLVAVMVIGGLVGGGIYLQRRNTRAPHANVRMSRMPVAAVGVPHGRSRDTAQDPGLESPGTDETRSDLYVLHGFVPYQEDERLAEMGVTSKEARERTNRLFAETFFTLVDAMAKHAEIQLDQPEHVIYVSALDQATRDGLRAQFYGALKEITGQAKFDDLASKGPLASVEYGMLGFGDSPVVIDLQPPSTGERNRNIVRLTFSTQAGSSSTGREVYSVSQAMSASVFDRYFGSLRAVANKSAFDWSSSEP